MWKVAIHCGNTQSLENQHVRQKIHVYLSVCNYMQNFEANLGLRSSYAQETDALNEWISRICYEK